MRQIGQQLGWRRISLVRFVEGAGAVRAEAVGQRHRTPTVAPIPLDAAVRLVASGVPSVVRRCGAG